MESTDAADPRQLLAAADIRRLGACATDGTVRLSKGEIDTYLAELTAAEDQPPETVGSYMPVIAEMVGLNAGISGELAKSLLFLLAHESFHLWVSGNAGPQAEFDADAHAVRVFLAEFPEIDPDRWVGPLRTTREDSDPADLFRAFLGRDPIVLLREMYGGTKSYEQGQLHPPLEERIARISEEIRSGRLKFTCEMIDQANAQAKPAVDVTLSSPANGTQPGFAPIPECTPKQGAGT